MSAMTANLSVMKTVGFSQLRHKSAVGTSTRVAPAKARQGALVCMNKSGEPKSEQVSFYPAASALCFEPQQSS
eukprot:7006464-Pyramimonas_sp.AAC.2